MLLACLRGHFATRMDVLAYINKVGREAIKERRTVRVSVLYTVRGLEKAEKLCSQLILVK